ncbi:2-iminobutanoate/2-iminopropanoate deaminase [Buchnera aphidicola (Anoecia corni)]|uniref:2-iminobutanoate/2-iminopropanoate deaminase n=1 Tax=Buchnera aphidicola (Anoecia corni) TaxID=2994477 RepID=A0AAT9IH47_9GAMM
MFKTIHTNKVISPLGPYVQGSIFNNMMFISGQIGLNKKPESSTKNITEETMFILNNINYILQEGEFKVNNIIKTTIYVTDIHDLKKINIAYEKFFLNHNSQFPTRSCVQVAKLPYDANIEIEAIAMKNL